MAESSEGGVFDEEVGDSEAMTISATRDGPSSSWIKNVDARESHEALGRDHVITSATTWPSLSSSTSNSSSPRPPSPTASIAPRTLGYPLSVQQITPNSRSRIRGHPSRRLSYLAPQTPALARPQIWIPAVAQWKRPLLRPYS